MARRKRGRRLKEEELIRPKLTPSPSKKVESSTNSIQSQKNTLTPEYCSECKKKVYPSYHINESTYHVIYTCPICNRKLSEMRPVVFHAPFDMQ